MKTKLIIIGASGLGREVLSWALDTFGKNENWEIKGFLDDRKNILDNKGIEYPILGTPSEYELQSEDRFICAIGDSHYRLLYARQLQAKGAQFLTLIHPTAIVGLNSVIGVGSILCPYATVTANAHLGAFVVLNIHAGVGHDSTLGDGCTLSAKCDVNGRCTLGEGVFMGTSSVVIPDRTIGDYVTIGAGSVVVRNTPSRVSVMGVPAKQIWGFSDAVEGQKS